MLVETKDNEVAVKIGKRLVYVLNTSPHVFFNYTTLVYTHQTN